MGWCSSRFVLVNGTESCTLCFTEQSTNSAVMTNSAEVCLFSPSLFPLTTEKLFNAEGTAGLKPAGLEFLIESEMVLSPRQDNFVSSAFSARNL